MCKKKIMFKNSIIYKKGKNWYCEINKWNDKLVTESFIKNLDDVLK